MRKVILFASGLSCFLVGCGGSSSAPLIPVTAQDQIADAVILAFQIREGEGMVNLEPRTSGSPKLNKTWSALTRDPWRGVFTRTQYSYVQLEPDDGVSPHYVVTNEFEFYSDSSMRQPAGTARQVVDTNEYTSREITTYQESLIAGPLAGFRSSRRASMDTGSSQTDFNATVAHPRFGSLSSTGTLIAGANNYEALVTKNGKTDRYSYSETPSTMIVSMSDGTKITISDVDGVITDSAGKNAATLVKRAGEVTVSFPGRDIVRQLWQSY
ncbi:MAG: hypothetical protein ABL949_11215 [Fimbriimonadaceae bacterium]